jgi:hypothetical protein
MEASVHLPDPGDHASLPDGGDVCTANTVAERHHQYPCVCAAGTERTKMPDAAHSAAARKAVRVRMQSAGQKTQNSGCSADERSGPLGIVFRTKGVRAVGLRQCSLRHWSNRVWQGRRGHGMRLAGRHRCRPHAPQRLVIIRPLATAREGSPVLCTEVSHVQAPLSKHAFLCRAAHPRYWKHAYLVASGAVAGLAM